MGFCVSLSNNITVDVCAKPKVKFKINNMDNAFLKIAINLIVQIKKQSYEIKKL